MKQASAPPRSYGQRVELAEGVLSRGLPCHCSGKAGNVYSVPVHIYRVLFLLLRQRRSAAGRSLNTTIKYLRCSTSDSDGNGLALNIQKCWFIVFPMPFSCRFFASKLPLLTIFHRMKCAVHYRKGPFFPPFSAFFYLRHFLPFPAIFHHDL